jgi:hypothetical protein
MVSSYTALGTTLSSMSLSQERQQEVRQELLLWACRIAFKNALQ